MARSPVRARTLAHLETLVAIGAMTVACTGGPGYGVVDPMPPPATGDPPQPSTGTIPEATPRPPDLGYAVVDPMPAPATCATFADALAPRAVVEGGRLLVTVSPDWPRYEGISFATDGKVEVRGAIVALDARKAETWALQLTPEPGRNSVEIEVRGTCAGKADTAAVTVSWTGAFGDQTPVTAFVGKAP